MKVPPTTPDVGDSIPPSADAPGSPLSNDERRDALERLCDAPAPVVGLEIIGGRGDGTLVNGWALNPLQSADDRDFTCPTCGTVLRVRGVERVGTFECCGNTITTSKPAPRRPRPPRVPRTR